MSDPEAHIAAWQAAGLIDAATADRLRAAPVATEAPAPATARADIDIAAAPPAPSTSAVSALFGPGVSIGEMFGYVGAAFLLGAWTTFLIRAGDSAGDPRFIVGLGSLLAAVVLAALGAWLMGGSDRFRRGAGVAFFVATGAVGAGVLALLGSTTGQRDSLPGVIAAAAALATAVAFRAFLPSVMTHVGALSGATGLVIATLGWIDASLRPEPVFDDFGNNVLTGTGGPDPLLLAVGQAVCWLALAIVIGFVGLREAASDTPAAARRASASRAWAGFVAVLGVAQAVLSNRTDADFTQHRVFEPAVAAALILIVCAVLVERAFRREASAYVYPAALGFMIAATDLNVTYLSNTIEIALLVEGGVLLGAGVVADRLRRRVGARSPVPPGEAPA